VSGKSRERAGSEVRQGLTDRLSAEHDPLDLGPSNGITEEGVVLEDKVLQIGAFRELERQSTLCRV